MSSMDVLLWLLIPFLGTTLGSAMVFFIKNKINNKIEKTTMMVLAVTLHNIPEGCIQNRQSRKCLKDSLSS